MTIIVFLMFTICIGLRLERTAVYFSERTGEFFYPDKLFEAVVFVFLKFRHKAWIHKYILSATMKTLLT